MDLILRVVRNHLRISLSRGGDDGGGGGGVPKEMTTLLSCVRVCCMIIRTAVVQAQTLKSL